MYEVLVNRLGGLSLPRKSVVRLTDRPDMTLDVYRGRKTTNQHQLSGIAQATAALTKVKPIWRYNNISIGSKVKLMRSLVISIFLYACESSTLTAELEKRTQAF